jgi:hypothetical protein
VKQHDSQPTRQSMREAHKVRRFRPGNIEHGRKYLGHKQKPWRPKAVSA